MPIARPTRWFLALAAALALTGFMGAAGGAARAAVPVEEDSSEAQIMGYYASAIAFTPLGRQGGRVIEVGIDLGYLPSLSEEDRETTFAGAKVENTNFTSVLPRARVRFTAAPGWLVEAGVFPSVQARGVTPEQYTAAVSAKLFGDEKVRSYWLRGHYLAADIVGPITCDEDAVEDPNNRVCYLGQPSEDHFKPTTYGLEFVIDGQAFLDQGLRWYAAGGLERQALDFQTYFINGFGRLDDQELIARVNRLTLAGGLTWSADPGVVVAIEMSYVPDALATVRLGIRWGWKR
ncbi:MAG TPA: hypothetical protein VJV75_08420 [Candidatus Polarisedimenticolia bacterium]|nr:hypothetical protein [Candidatus Polarisedimenticolia bacterium]